MGARRRRGEAPPATETKVIDPQLLGTRLRLVAGAVWDRSRWAAVEDGTSVITGKLLVAELVDGAAVCGAGLAHVVQGQEGGQVGLKVKVSADLVPGVLRRAVGAHALEVRADGVGEVEAAPL